MQTTLDEVSVQQPVLLSDLSLHEDDLTKQVKSEFSCHTEILRAFELTRCSILENELLTPVGRHLFLSDIDRSYKQCKQVLNYMASNNELLRCNLPQFGPLFICSLPRTGSTLLYNLLACDPNCRAPLYTEMAIDPVPPISPSNSAEHERRTAERTSATLLRYKLADRTNLIPATHPILPIEEDVHIIQQTGLFLSTVLRSPLYMTEYEDWLHDTTNKSFAYNYHEIFMRMLNSIDAPASHWLFKWPPHILFLDALLTQYPHAAIVMTHRRLEEVLPSFCRLVLAWSNVYFNNQDPTVETNLTIRSLRLIDRMIKRMMEFRARSKDLHKTIFDVNYEELIQKPIATVRRIYEHFGLVWSQDFETAMSAWIDDNPQGKQGRLTYSLPEFDLTSESIQLRYADYIKTFLSSSTSSENRAE